MTTRSRCLFVLIFVFVCALSATTNYFMEKFENLQYNNSVLTTADWNTIDQIGAPGRLSARELATTSASAGYPVDVATNGKYVFVAMENSGGFAIQEIGGHTNQVTLSTGDNEQGVAIDGRYAYIVDDGGQITQIDCGDVTTAPYLENDDLSGTDLRAVAVSNGWLYMASDAGLIAKDGYDGGSQTVATTNAQDVAIYGPYILLADGDGGLRIFEHLNTGAAPVSVGSIALSDCRGVSVYGTYAIMGAGDSVFIVDISNPASPSVTNRLGTTGDCNSACALSGKIYAACGANGTMVFVGDDFTNMRPIGITPNPTSPATGSATSVVAIGHEVAVAQADNGGVQYLTQGNDLNPPAGWSGNDTIAHRNPIAAVTHGDYLYVSEQTYGLITYDLKTMSVVDSIQVPDGTSATGLCAAGNYLLQGLGVGGLRCYNLANPADPSIAWTESSIGGGATVMDVDANGAYAYVAAAGFGTTGIYKIPILGGSHSAVASDAIGSNVYSIDVNGQIVYVAATSNGLKAYDLDLTEIDTYTYTSGACENVVAENDYAYVSYGAGGLLILDVSDVHGSGISLTSNLTYAQVGDVLTISRFDNYLCLGEDDPSSPLQFVDVSDPTTPGLPTTSLAGVSVPSGLSIPAAMTKWNDNLVVVDYLTGVYTWQTYPNDCTDSLIENTSLYSNKFNTIDGIRFANWKSWEFYPSDDLDTCDYYMVYYKAATAAWDTLWLIYSPNPGFNEYQRPVPLPWSSEAWYWIEGFAGSGFDSIWWHIDITEKHDVWSDPDSTGPGGPYSGVWLIDSLMIGYGNGLWPGTRGGALSLHFDFGGGDSQDLIIGMDSSATNRYDPGLDIPFVPPTDRPYACWALDDPTGPEDVGLSACYAPTRVGARPVRLILSNPATVSWSIPPDMVEGSFVLNGIDLTTTTSIDLPAGEYDMLPGGGFAIYFQNEVERGWNLVAPNALPIWGSPAEAFNVVSTNIWCYDDEMGGYYNPDEIEQGKAYFVFADRDKIGEFCGVMNDWVRTEIHPGWNLISGPAAGTVHVSNLITNPDSAIWYGPIYKMTDTGYEATEWLHPGEGYWAYGLEEAELFVDTLVSGTRKSIPIEDPDFSTKLVLSFAGNETHLSLGLDPQASSSIDSRFDRLLPPARPGTENIGYLYSDGAPAPLSTDVIQKGQWELHIRRNCTAKSDFPLLATRNGESYEIDPAGISLEPGVYKVSYSEQSLPEMMAIAVRPNPFNAMAFVQMEIPFAGKVELAAYDINGRKVNKIFEGNLSAGIHSRVWRGNDNLGRSLPSGVYFLKLKIDEEHTVSTKAILLK